MSEWTKLRTFHGSQQTAFEELCCQLARHEELGAGARFTRKGAPDAGVECYWTLPDGGEWGWQAKFFLEVPGASQWQQLRESFSTALAKHPRLVRYWVCLPQNRADPRVPGRASFQDRWDEFVTWCLAQARTAGRTVAVEYWGDSEIFERLALPAHRGRQLFWFDAERFTPCWFQQRLDEAVANAGDRYSPELNIDLPIGRTLDGLGRTERFWRRFTARVLKVRNRWVDHFADTKLTGFNEAFTAFLGVVNRIEPVPDAALDFAGLRRQLRLVRETVVTGWQEVTRLDEAAKEKKEPHDPHSRPSDNLRRGLRQVDEALEAMEEFVIGADGQAADRRWLLLRGRAGAGKTHLFCDAARHRLKEGKPSVLVLGESIQKGGPWMQVINLLGLTMNRDDFLGALNTAAESAGTRLILFMDALNEGDGMQVWPTQLAGFLEAVKPFPSLVVALSVRDLYESRVVPAQLDHETLMRVDHQGFEEKTEEATRRFFQHFKISLPDHPILNPEFGTPLFLKLFCTALRNRGISEVPKGMGGITTIFSFFLESINRKLAVRLDYDPAQNLVEQAVSALAGAMAREGDDAVPASEARDLLLRLLPNTGFELGLLQQLCSEGILHRTIQRDWSTKMEWEVVRFSYQRLSDHLIVGEIIAQSIDAEGKPVNTGATLLGCLLNADNAWRCSSWIEALAVQLPERFGLELSDLSPALDPQIGEQAFLASLLWRRADAHRPRTLELVESKLAEERTRQAILQRLLLVTAQPDHPLNANFLHGKLLPLGLAERDLWWSIFLYHDYSETGSVPGVIEWAWAERDRSRISDEAIELYSTTLAWFFTSSHRFLRDRATKALVSLLEGREQVLLKLLGKFRDVNDPYVAERMYAVAHGVVVRSEDNAGVKAVAEWIHRELFAAGAPPPSVLLRMHAAAAVQAAVAKGLVPSIDPATIRPPFRSEWPETVPSLGELKKLFHDDTWDKPTWGLRRIIHSVTGDDFSHYVIGNSVDWSCYRLDRPAPLGAKEKFARLLKRRPSIGIAATAYSDLQALERMAGSDWGQKRAAESGVTFPDDFPARRAELESQVTRLLASPRDRKHVAWVVEYLRDPLKSENEELFGFDLVRCHILQKVLSLGYRADWFSQFDDDVPMDGRSAHKPERIGKKYQWIAYHEIIARIGDNFRFLRNACKHEEKGWREGGWMRDYRDIDPSLLLQSDRTDEEEGEVAAVDPQWWLGQPYDAWATRENDLTWLHNADDLPKVPDLVRVTDPQNGSRWLNLNSFVIDRQVERLGAIERHKPEKREVFRFLFSYLVRQRDAAKFAQWARTANFTGRWMPEPRDYYRYPLHEFYWAPQFAGEQSWTGSYFPGKQVPVPIATTGGNYLCESSTFDCSLSDTVWMSLPSKVVVDKLGLRMKGRRGHFYDASGERVAYDPSVGEETPRTLLFRESTMTRFLQEQKLELFWVLLGEKNVYPNDFSMNRGKWLGRLEYYGAYRYGPEITGQVNTGFAAGGGSK